MKPKKEAPASYSNPAKTKVEAGPCACYPKAAVLSRVTWRPWGGTKYKYRCQTCGKEWPRK